MRETSDTCGLNLEEGVTCWQLSKSQVLHGSCGDERFLWVEEHMSERVHTHVVVGDVDAHRLLAHGALVGVTWGLVVIGEGNDGGTNAENHTWVNLQKGKN